MSFQVRQGDLLIEVSELPKEARKLETQVVAYGEVTGHAHRVEGNGVLFADAEDNTYIQTGDNVSTLIHDEHGPISLPKNQILKVTRQREYDAIEAERERRVAD